MGRHDRAKRERKNKQKRKEREMNAKRRACRRPEVHVSSDSIDPYAKNVRPGNAVKGWFSGNRYAVSERERLQFDRSCAPCSNTGKEPCQKGECTKGPTPLTWGGHWHTCTKPCANCAIAQRHFVYLCIQVKDATSNSWHGVGKQCLLLAIEEKRFDRKPQATIKIGDQTYKVNSTDLELEKFKAMEAGNALEVGDGAYRSGKAQPLQRRNSEPFGRRSHDRSRKTVRASSLPISSSRRKPSLDRPRSIGSVKDMRTDDDIMGDEAVAETIRRGEMMNDIVTTHIDPEFDERELSLEMQRALSRDSSNSR